MGRIRLSKNAAEVIAWLGLALISASFIVLVLNSQPFLPRIITRSKRPQPVSVVILDPGHGGQDSGAMSGNVLEKDLTLDVAQRVERLLGAQGVATVMTRVGDAYVSLADRSAIANRISSAVFVSIHFNDGSRPLASGVETYFAAHQMMRGPQIATWLPFLQKISSEEPNIESQSLAGFIQQELVSRTQAANRGTKSEQFYVLANVRHPAVLVEAGFLTNKDDVMKLSDASYREQLAIGISNGVLAYRDALKHRAPVLTERPSAD
ncbi:MAG TPA: N-acetylmuramoyl-L-alanine amidase [Chthoniobacterales bacterium]|jgi:N-acetylmuramoyl-L-alanine amidase